MPPPQTDYSGDSQLVNSIYLDNTSLEIYHGRIENRPNAVILRLSWYGSQEPTEVMVQRKSYSTNSDGETNLEHSFTLPADAIPGFLEGENVLSIAISGWRAKASYSFLLTDSLGSDSVLILYEFERL